MTPSVEHVMSLEPSEMKNFVKTIRDLEIALGVNRLTLHPDEKAKRDDIRRSVFIRENAKAGQKLSECRIEFRRPGCGITPDRYEEICGAV